MIATLTPNPSLDLLFEAERLVWDDANRVAPPRRRPGGQGINVVRAARALGGTALAIAPLGGMVGAELAGMLAAEGAPLVAVPIAGESRTFVGVRERETGRSLLLNPAGPLLSDAEAEALLDAARAVLEAERPAWIACCGSIARGLPADFYARVGRMARERGARFVPDCDGEALRRAAESGCDLLVPNIHEAARLLGEAPRGAAEAAAAAAALLRFGPALAAITLGAEGAVAATAGGAWHAAAPRVDGGSAVGAGDAFLAALLLALEQGEEPPEALRAGVAAGTAVLLAEGESLLKQQDFDALRREVLVRKIG